MLGLTPRNFGAALALRHSLLVALYASAFARGAVAQDATADDAACDGAPCPE